MSRATKAVLDDPYFHPLITDKQRAWLHQWFNIPVDKLH